MAMMMMIMKKKKLHKSANKTISFAYFCTKVFNVKLNESTMDVGERKKGGGEEVRSRHNNQQTDRI